MAKDDDELKRQLEKLAGRDIDLTSEALRVSLFHVTSTYNFESGNVASQSIFLPGIRCRQTNLLDAGGVVGTGSDGKRTFLLSEFVCLPQDRLLAEPVNIVATARTDKPVFVTTQHTLVDPTDFRRSNVQITIFSWTAAGDPAPNVAVDWRCRVVSEIIIL